MTPDTLYIDPRRRFAIGYFSELPPEMTLCVDASDWEDTDGIPILRAVYTLDDFHEKISMLDEDLDDVSVERMKFFMARLMRPGLHLERRDLRFAGRDRVPAWRDDVEHGRLHFTYYLSDEKAMVNVEIPMLWYYDQLYACTIDAHELSGRGGSCGEQCFDDAEARHSGGTCVSLFPRGVAG